MGPARLLCPWGFSRQECWTGLLSAPPGDVPDPRIELAALRLLYCKQTVYCLSQWGSHIYTYMVKKSHTHTYVGFPADLVVKNQPAIAGDAGYSGLIPGSGRSPGGGNGNPTPVFLAWRIPWTEEPAGLRSTGSQRGGHD